MKYIEKTTEDSQTGATASYHEITGLNIDFTNNQAAVIMSSYVSAKARSIGKNALSFSSFTLENLPAERETITYEWALNQLIQPVPESFTPEDYTGYINPYTFAGGKVKDAVV